MAFLDRFKKKGSELEERTQDSSRAKEEKVAKAEKTSKKAAPVAEKAGKKPSTEKTAKKTTKKTPKKETKTKKETSAKKPSVSPASPAVSKLNNVVLHPLITEKSTIVSETGTYVFFVDGSANKIQIKQAVQQVYNVTPMNVRVLNQKGKAVRWGRISGRRADQKKAYVTLKAGDKIDLAV